MPHINFVFMDKADYSEPQFDGMLVSYGKSKYSLKSCLHSGGIAVIMSEDSCLFFTF